MTHTQFTKQEFRIQASTTGFFPAVSSAAQKTQSTNDDIYKITEATMSTSARKTGEEVNFGRTSAFQDNHKTVREANLQTQGITSSLGYSDEGETEQEVKCTTGMTFAKGMEDLAKVPGGKNEKNQFFNRTFTKFNQIKRRNPNKYMHNPAKAHFTTLGSHDYVYEDTNKKDSTIRTHSNELRKLRYDYKSLLPGAPHMSVDKETVKQQKAYSPTKNGEKNSFLTLVDDERKDLAKMNRTMGPNMMSTEASFVDDRLMPESSQRHRNSEFEQYLTIHTQQSPNLKPMPYPIDESGRKKKTEVMDHIIKIKKNIQKKNDDIREQQKHQNEEMFMKYIQMKKDALKQKARFMKQEVHKKTELSIAGLSSKDHKQSYHSFHDESVGGGAISSNSSEGLIDDEDHQTAKVIQKLTGSNLDIKALDIDFSQIRHFVHTPKNGVKEPAVDTSLIQDKLHKSGFLIFNPMDRPSQTLSKRNNSRPKSPTKAIIVLQESALNMGSKRKERVTSPLKRESSP